MTVVMGFDTSLTVSGCVRLDLLAGAPIRWTWWRARAEKPAEESTVMTRRRIRVMLREILALTPDRFDLAVVEGPAMGAKHAGLADERAGLRWMLIDQLLPRGPVVIVSPAARAQFGSGSGSGSKEQVFAGAQRLFPLASIPEHGAGRYDVADAVVLAAMGAHSLGMPWPEPLTQKQTTAFAKVAWPAVDAAA